MPYRLVVHLSEFRLYDRERLFRAVSYRSLHGHFERELHVVVLTPAFQFPPNRASCPVTVLLVEPLE